ncbi:uncharacterized protein EV154DRAFT_506804 [Mucor mucedo]|uniref:uncharacterized protein n=1 Tax=Mucor mucedo TaxID=29922 RepID=UPI00221E75FF|nr:uncharacterized protein EV154DRAFT_506804 [Mucor mucedo]KAI7891887.1 hypothetical protein EV154DRAFT_506804 [Mucor mucedo]
MNNTEANNNTSNNARGRGRGRGNGRGGRRGRGKDTGTFVFVVDPIFQRNATPVNNSNAQTENNNANVEDDNEPSRPYNVWPEVAICILLEIMAGTYSHLLRRGDTSLKQLIWIHSAALLKEKIIEYANTDEIRAFVANVTPVSMQRKWKDMKNRFTKARNAARETGVDGTVSNVPYYEEIAKIIQDNPSIQPEGINMEENGIRPYRRSNDIDLMNSIGSDGPKTTYVAPTEVDQLVIQKALTDRYATEDPVDPEGSSVPSSTSAPTPTPTDLRPAGPTPTELVIAVDETEAVWRSSLKRSIEALEVVLKEKEREAQNIKKKINVLKEQL